MTPLVLSGRWDGPSNSLRIRVARALDRLETATRIEVLLRQHGAPIAYEVFDRSFVLCEPALPGVSGDPDISIVIGDAEHDLFFVAQRERGGLSSLSVHAAIHDAVWDFLRRAAVPSNLHQVSRVIVTLPPVSIQP
ncbi:MAG: hypothetical protein Q8O26_02485 [Phreatobacter sp.]|uniref:hypothetical protein n=1 Tax=Phreatobacter sp. TaxID=1966341 RepID=UPI0027343F43|nr:hypothetical protein [Phreatobacter sp.]MDP2800728.1 hypothetical protein [Phreatobacter sp.]